jgi:uncharacterized protein (TIGR00369 family)
MRKIKNAFTSPRANKCFACSSTNEFGLQMEFHDEGEEIVCYWKPKAHFDGWKGIVHGGIQATLIDEAGEWYVFTKIGRSAVTMNLDIRYKAQLRSDKGEISIRAKLINYARNMAEIAISVFDAENKLCSKATGKYYVYSEEESKEQFDFPGQEKFYE